MKKISFKNAFLLVFFLLIYSFFISFSFGHYYNDYKNFKTSINFVKLKDNTTLDSFVEFPDEGFNSIENEFVDIVKESISINLGEALPTLNDYFIEQPNNIDELTLDYYKNGKQINVNNIAEKVNDKYIAKVLGSYDVFVGGYVSELFILDTEKPIVTFKNLTVYENSFISIKDFIDTYIDNSGSPSYISIIKNNDEVIKKPGTYNMTIMVCDESMNCIDGTAKLIVLKRGNTSTNTQPQKPSNPNSGSSGGNTTTPPSNSGGNTEVIPPTDIPDQPVIPPDNPPTSEEPQGPVTYVKDIEVKEIVSKEEIKYGVNRVGYIYAIYELYSDGSKKRKDATEVYYEIDYSSFNATISQMKPEAIEVYNKTLNTRNHFLNATNQYRNEVGVNNLVLDETLCIMATIRAMEIAYSRQFSHTRPDGSQWNTVIKDSSFNFKTSFAGENLAGNFASDETAMLGLRRSTGHYNTMINSKFNKMGVGVYTFNGQTYWAQLFAA